MFGFGKGSKVTASIGAALHHQLYSAMKENEALTNDRLMSLFTNGYTSSFVFCVYGLQGLNAEKMLGKNFRNILDGVLPARLYEIFDKQNEMRKLSESMSDKASFSDMFTGNQDPKYFTESQLLAREEAEIYVKTGDVNSVSGWQNYLTGKDIYSEV